MPRFITSLVFRCLVCLGAGIWLVMFVSAAVATPLPGAPNCPIFPPDSPWNQRVDQLPVLTGSWTLVSAIGLAAPLHAEFGRPIRDWTGDVRGIPFAVVSNQTPRVGVSFDDPTRSDRGPYPFRTGPRSEVE